MLPFGDLASKLATVVEYLQLSSLYRFLRLAAAECCCSSPFHGAGGPRACRRIGPTERIPFVAYSRPAALRCLKDMVVVAL